MLQCNTVPDETITTKIIPVVIIIMKITTAVIEPATTPDITMFINIYAKNNEIILNNIDASSYNILVSVLCIVTTHAVSRFRAFF